jgi:group I intron endonuclease
MNLIYQLRNLINNKCYIGKTRDLKTRIRRHLQEARSGTPRHLYNAINKYGFDKFNVEVLEEGIADEFVDDRERFWIGQANSLHPIGYNMTPGGEGGNTLASWSVYQKQTLYQTQGEKRKGSKRTDKQRQNISKAATLRETSKSPDQKAKIERKISNTHRNLGTKPPRTVLWGTDNPNYVSVDIDQVLDLIRNNYNLKEIASHFETTNQTIWTKLKATGRTFLEWRKYYGLSGTYRRS